MATSGSLNDFFGMFGVEMVSLACAAIVFFLCKKKSSRENVKKGTTDQRAVFGLQLSTIYIQLSTIYSTIRSFAAEAVSFCSQLAPRNAGQCAMLLTQVFCLAVVVVELYRGFDVLEGAEETFSSSAARNLPWSMPRIVTLGVPFFFAGAILNCSTFWSVMIL